MYAGFDLSYFIGFSDTEEEEDVTVVKISRRRKGTAKNGGRWHNSTTTINAPAGSVVEVDLTQGN